ncbi:MAG: 2-oxo acid dehydrogenase subunit E2, partial [Akkermansiaceae bacterium]|nr:2-oxo acid dehydrogenase subunit E2 [Armatimonadota bacterium]
MSDIILPKMGDAMEEGRIVQWLKNVGDAVKSGEAIAELETDKSNVEIEADADGFLTAINVQAGDMVPVGTVIGVIGAEAGAVAAPTSKPAELASAQPAKTEAVAKVDAPKAEEKPETTTGEGTLPVAPEGATNTTAPASPQNTNGSAPKSSTPLVVPSYTVVSGGAFKPYNTFIGALPENLGGSASTIGEPITVEAAGSSASGGAVKASPLAKAMAQANKLDLAAIAGSGENGVVMKADVEAALTQAPAVAPQPRATVAPATSAPVALAVGDGDTVQEFNAMRRTIAKRLTESKSTIPHFYVTAELDMEAFLAFREQLNTSAAPNAGKISVTDMITKACAVALVENPVVNSAFSDNKRITRKSVNIGIAVSIEDGLIVPVVKGCENKSLRAIAKETRPLIEKARENKLNPDEYTGGTFTISNLGQFDVENFAAIINPGEGAILAIASVRDVAAVVDGQIVPRKRMKVTL